MYSVLHGILSDKKGGEIFTLFGIWHFIYIALTVAAVIFLYFFLKNKGDTERKKVIGASINFAFALYIADLFLMPLAYGEIDIEKLPFHACTAMCVACFLSYHSRFWEKFRSSFALLGLISNLVYLIYPAGVMWHAVHPLSYRVIQTLLFHSVMTVYGVLVLIFQRDLFAPVKCYRDLGVTVCMTLWALIGNYAYNGSSEGYSHFFNWFFVVRDPFWLIPEAVAPFIMPFLNIIIFFAVEMAIYALLSVARRLRRV